MRRRPADTHSEDATQTQGNAGGGQQASTPGVPLLDAVFVPRALREVCLLAEPL